MSYSSEWTFQGHSCSHNWLLWQYLSGHCGPVPVVLRNRLHAALAEGVRGGPY